MSSGQSCACGEVGHILRMPEVISDFLSRCQPEDIANRPAGSIGCLG